MGMMCDFYATTLECAHSWVRSVHPHKRCESTWKEVQFFYYYYYSRPHRDVQSGRMSNLNKLKRQLAICFIQNIQFLGRVFFVLVFFISPAFLWAVRAREILNSFTFSRQRVCVEHRAFSFDNWRLSRPTLPFPCGCGTHTHREKDSERDSERDSARVRLWIVCDCANREGEREGCRSCCCLQLQFLSSQSQVRMNELWGGSEVKKWRT